MLPMTLIGRVCPASLVSHYIVKTWAYNTIEKANQTGSLAPRFYGSWTFTIPIVFKGVRTERPVRLILIERLDGVSFQTSRVQNTNSTGAPKDTFHYPEEYRLEVLARAIDGYVRQIKVGVRQSDFAGRNIVLVPNQNPAAQSEMIGGLYLPRIVLVDYNNADLEDSPPDTADPRPHNPAQIFWDHISGLTLPAGFQRQGNVVMLKKNGC